MLKKILLIIFLPFNIYSLDTTFGQVGTGYVTKSFGDSSQINSISIDSNGNIFTGGFFRTENIQKIALCKFNYQGILDTTFGSQGLVTYNFNNDAEIKSLAITPDNKIIVAGYVILDGVSNLLIAKFNNDGTISNFGQNGIVTQPLNDGVTIESICIDINGKILTAGTSYNSGKPYFTIIRFNSDGVIDNSFGDSGKVIICSGNYNYLTKIIIDSSNRIVAGGYFMDNDGTKSILIRLNSDGSIDNSFGDSGIKIVAVNNYSRIFSIAIQDDGKILTTGDTDIYVNSKFCTMRFDSDGKALDENFGVNGKVIQQLKNYDLAKAIIIQNINSEKKIVVAGCSGTGIEKTISVVRYNLNGTLDSTFGNDHTGIISTNITSGSGATCLAIAKDNSIVFGGFDVFDGSDNLKYQFALVKYLVSNMQYIKIDSPLITGSTIYTKRPVISGTSSALSAFVDIYINDTFFKTVTTDENGDWTTNTGTTILLRGTNSIKVDLRIESNIIASTTSIINVDAWGMALFSSPENGSTITNSTIHVFGTSWIKNGKIMLLLDETFFANVDTNEFGDWDAGNTTILNNGVHRLMALGYYNVSFAESAAISVFTVNHA